MLYLEQNVEHSNLKSEIIVRGKWTENSRRLEQNCAIIGGSIGKQWVNFTSCVKVTREESKEKPTVYLQISLIFLVPRTRRKKS